jgi:two-component system, cell cycle sensor histidine kinase and response regulator CckA
LTRQLLAFSRRQVLQPEVLDVGELVEDLAPMLRRLIGEDVELVTTVEPALGPILADPGQLHQVIVNLAVNARDAMPDGGRLNVTCANADLGAEAAAAMGCPPADTWPWP